MVYTLSNGLRDREYAKFTQENIGSFTAINANPIIKTYTFNSSDCYSTGGTGSGFIQAYSSRELNGMLEAIYIEYNDYQATGSLYLVVSGINLDVWDMQSGTNTGMISVSGALLPRAFCRNSHSASGTNNPGTWEKIPLFGTYILIGSGLGETNQGSGITIVYS